MMYQKSGNYVACVKVDGKILREDAEGMVKLPFGSEFSILLKNLNSLRATATVSVDGVNATESTSLIVPANGEIELERFIKGGNMLSGNKFKFIERTAGIEAHKGIGSSDGLIRIEYKSEVQPVIHQQIVQHVQNPYPYWPYQYHPYYPYRYYPSWTLGGGIIGSIQSNSQNVGAQSSYSSGDLGEAQGAMGAMNMAQMNITKSESSVPRPRFGSGGPMRSSGPQASAGTHKKASLTRSRSLRSSGDEVFRGASLNDVGITVPGAESNQKFTAGAWFKTEDIGHVIVLQLRGVVGGKPVIQAITVKTKAKCTSCGKINKATDKFCSDCGTALLVI